MRVATKASDFEVSVTGIERPGQVKAGLVKLTRRRNKLVPTFFRT